MTENTQTGAQTPVNDTQGTAMPTVPQQAAQKTPEAEITEPKDGLPKEVSERTRAEFDKMEANYRKQLKDERTRREEVEHLYQVQFQPKQTQQIDKPIIDPTTGLIDATELEKLQKEAREARAEALKAREEVTSYKQRGEYEKAYQKYEWTNPESKNFDEKRSNLAAAIALASMVEPKRYGGKQLDLEGAANFIEGLTNKQVEQVRKEAAQEAIEQLSPKEQASLEATGNAGRRTEADTQLQYDQVREITRKGGKDSIMAIAARLNALRKAQVSSK